MHSHFVVIRTYVRRNERRIMKSIVYTLIFWSIFQICYYLLLCILQFLLFRSLCVYSVFCCCFDSFWLLFLKSALCTLFQQNVLFFATKAVRFFLHKGAKVFFLTRAQLRLWHYSIYVSCKVCLLFLFLLCILHIIFH